MVDGQDPLAAVGQQLTVKATRDTDAPRNTAGYTGRTPRGVSFNGQLAVETSVLGMPGAGRGSGPAKDRVRRR